MFLKAVVVSILFCSSAFAQFAVVNMKQIEDDALVTKNLKENVIKASENLEQEVNKARDEMEKKVATLQRAASSLSPDAAEKQRAALQKEFLAIEGRLQEHDSSLQEAKLKALDEISSKIKQISTKIAKDKGFDLVLSNSLVIYYSPKSDITAEIISDLNKEMKVVAFNVKSKKKK